MDIKKQPMKRGKKTLKRLRLSAAAVNEERIAKLENENQQLRQQVNSLEGRVERLEKAIDNFFQQHGNEQDAQQYSTAEQNPSTSVQFKSELSTFEPHALPEDEDAPSWTPLSKAAATELYSKYPEPITFIRNTFMHIFTEIQAFQLELPANLQKEFEKICIYFLNPCTQVELKKIKEQLITEIKYQREKLRNRITVPKTPAVAMISKAVPLMKIVDIWLPTSNDVQFDRVNNENLLKWPVLMKNDQMCDTMYAERKNPLNARSYWKYFIITRDGGIIACSKE